MGIVSEWSHRFTLINPKIHSQPQWPLHSTGIYFIARISLFIEVSDENKYNSGRTFRSGKICLVEKAKSTRNVDHVVLFINIVLQFRFSQKWQDWLFNFDSWITLYNSMFWSFWTKHAIVRNKGNVSKRIFGDTFQLYHIDKLLILIRRSIDSEKYQEELLSAPKPWGNWAEGGFSGFRDGGTPLSLRGWAN